MHEMVEVLEQRPVFDFEIILVNDGSDDGTFEIISALCGDFRIKGLDLSRNFGQPAATMAGLTHSSGSLIVYADDDGQTPFQDLWGLIGSLDETTDVVFAQLDNREISWIRRFGSKAADVMANTLLGKSKNVRMGNFWVARRFVINQVLLSRSPFPYLGGLLIKSTQRIGGFQTAIRPRRTGLSGYRLISRLSLWLDGATAFSVAPLRISALIGVFFGLVGLALAATAVIRWVSDPAITPGYTSLFASTIFFGGLNLVAIGLVGEYVGRLYLSVNGLPQFVTRSKINLD